MWIQSVAQKSETKAMLNNGNVPMKGPPAGPIIDTTTFYAIRQII